MAKPRLAVLYQEAGEFFGPRSKKLIDQVAEKGTVGGDVGMYRLFAPAILLGLGDYPDISYETAVVAKNIPFSSATTVDGTGPPQQSPALFVC